MKPSQAASPIKTIEYGYRLTAGSCLHPEGKSGRARTIDLTQWVEYSTKYISVGDFVKLLDSEHLYVGIKGGSYVNNLHCPFTGRNSARNL